MAGHVGYRQADEGEEAVCESSVSGDAKVVKALARSGLLDTLSIDCVCSSGIDQARMKILSRWLDMSATVRPTKGRLCESHLSVVMRRW